VTKSGQQCRKMRQDPAERERSSVGLAQRWAEAAQQLARSGGRVVALQCAVAVCLSTVMAVCLSTAIAVTWVWVCGVSICTATGNLYIWWCGAKDGSQHRLAECVFIELTAVGAQQVTTSAWAYLRGHGDVKNQAESTRLTGCDGQDAYTVCSSAVCEMGCAGRSHEYLGTGRLCYSVGVRQTAT
jgi:hypothetical protein